MVLNLSKPSVVETAFRFPGQGASHRAHVDALVRQPEPLQLELVRGCKQALRHRRDVLAWCSASAGSASVCTCIWTVPTIELLLSCGLLRLFQQFF